MKYLIYLAMFVIVVVVLAGVYVVVREVNKP
jgi:hypothetical protein